MNILTVKIAEKINQFRNHRSGSVDVNKDRFIIDPRMANHQCVADTKTEVLLFERLPALNTNDRTKEDFQET